MLEVSLACLGIGKLATVNMSFLLKLVNRFSAGPIKILCIVELNLYFVEVGMQITKLKFGISVNQYWPRYCWGEK